MALPALGSEGFRVESFITTTTPSKTVWVVNIPKQRRGCGLRHLTKLASVWIFAGGQCARTPRGHFLHRAARCSDWSATNCRRLQPLNDLDLSAGTSREICRRNTLNCGFRQDNLPLERGHLLDSAKITIQGWVTRTACATRQALRPSHFLPALAQIKPGNWWGRSATSTFGPALRCSAPLKVLRTRIRNIATQLFPADQLLATEVQVSTNTR